MRLVVIGGNAAGMSAAAKMRRSQKDVEIAVYEQGNIVSFGSCGLPYYIGGFFEDSRRMFARAAQSFIDSGIDLKLKHSVTALNPAEKTVTVEDENGVSFIDSYDKLLITTGASPVTPDFPGKNFTNIFTLRTLEDGDKIKAALKETGAHAVIVGGGFIGLELAEALRKQNKSVRVIELEDRIMKAALDEEFSSVVEDELRTHGIELCTGEKVLRFAGDSAVRSVETDKGSYPADLVILSIGIRPNTSFLNGAGLKRMNNGAIFVDKQGRTSVDDIYSAGDCAAVPHMLSRRPVYVPLATTANKLGRIVGENLAGGNRYYPGTLASSCVKVFDVEAGRTGYTERDIKELSLKTKSVVVKDKNQTDYYPGQEDILLKITYLTENRKIVSAQCIGKKGAVLRIDALASAIQGGLTVDDLALADFCYAPPFSRTWDVMNTAGNVAK